RSVFAVAHRIMGEDPDTRKLHDGGKADRWSCIVAEDEERRAERAQLRQYESIHDRRHGVLSDAEVEIPASGSRGFKISRFGKCQERFVRRAEIRRSSQEPGNALSKDVQYFAGSVAAREALGIGGEAWQVAVPSDGQLAPLHLVDLSGEFRKLIMVSGKQRLPAAPRLGPARANTSVESARDPVRYQELCVLGPAVGSLGEPDLLFAQGLAVGRRSVDLVWGAVADMAVQNDQGRPALGLAENGKRICDPLEIVGITHPQYVPPIAEEARRDILREGDACIAFDGDVVIVVDPAEVIEAEMAGQRGRLRADPFHHAAVAADSIDVIVKYIEANAVVTISQPSACDRHADTGGNSLTQRTGCRLDAGDPMIFRVSRRLAVELAEVADVVDGD